MSTQLKTIQQMEKLQAAIDAMEADVKALNSSYVQSVHLEPAIETRDFNHKGADAGYLVSPTRLAAFLSSEIAQHREQLRKLICSLDVPSSPDHTVRPEDLLGQRRLLDDDM